MLLVMVKASLDSLFTEETPSLICDLCMPHWAVVSQSKYWKYARSDSSVAEFGSTSQHNVQITLIAGSAQRCQECGCSMIISKVFTCVCCVSVCVGICVWVSDTINISVALINCHGNPAPALWLNPVSLVYSGTVNLQPPLALPLSLYSFSFSLCLCVYLCYVFSISPSPAVCPLSPILCLSLPGRRRGEYLLSSKLRMGMSVCVRAHTRLWSIR